MMHRFYALSTSFAQRWGGPVRKLPLDAGGSCPNRDGTLGHGGCVYCNPAGSGTGLAGRGLSLAAQWELWRNRLPARWRGARLMAYLQSYSVTHRSPESLAALIEEAARLPGVSSLSCGTRPDCLGEEHLALIAAAPFAETWLELGLQSASDETLTRLNRGHDAATFADAVRHAAAAGLPVCAHLMAGLPGEGIDDFLETIEYVNALPVAAVKFHNTFVARGATLETWHAAGTFAPMDRDVYVDAVCQGLARLRSNVVVQRLCADPAPGELVSPAWAADKASLLRDIRARLEAHDLWQGAAADAPAGPPAWFSPDNPPPEKKP